MRERAERSIHGLKRLSRARLLGSLIWMKAQGEGEVALADSALGRARRQAERCVRLRPRGKHPIDQLANRHRYNFIWLQSAMLLVHPTR